MNRALLLAMSVPAIAGAFVWAGCALVIDLGDEVALRQPDTSTIDVVDAAPNDAGSDAPVLPGDGAPACGFRQMQNEVCADCFDKSCCAKGIACADSPACVKGLACLQYCMGQYFGCIDGCLAEAAEAEADAGTLVDAGGSLMALASCSQDFCNESCTPHVDCIAYGKCALVAFADAGQVLKDNARNIVLQNDDKNCIKQLDLLRGTPEGAACQ